MQTDLKRLSRTRADINVEKHWGEFSPDKPYILLCIEPLLCARQGSRYQPSYESVVAAVTKYQGLGALEDRNVVLTVPEAGSPGSRC